MAAGGEGGAWSISGAGTVSRGANGATGGLLFERDGHTATLSTELGLSSYLGEATRLELAYFLERHQYEYLDFELGWVEEELRLAASHAYVRASGAGLFVSCALRLRLLEGSGWEPHGLLSVEGYVTKRASVGLFVDSLKDEIALGGGVELPGQAKLSGRVGAGLAGLLSHEGTELAQTFLEIGVSCRF